MEMPSSQGLEQLDILLPPSFHPAVCSTSCTFLQWFPRDCSISYHSVSGHTQGPPRRGGDHDLVKCREQFCLAPTSHRLCFLLSSSAQMFNYPTRSTAASAEVVESNFPCCLGQWGFSKRMCMHVSAGRKIVWSQVFHISEESPNCWIPKEKHNIGNLWQLHKVCSGATGMCLNIRH